MPGSDFDIFQTEDGYVAVTNEIRRAILAALLRKDRQLPELVKLTKRSKPTLSSVHMRELLASKLVEEISHPTDKRKKIYRLKGRRIGSSNLPVDELRDAVRTYAGASAQGALAAALEAIAAAPASTPEATLRAQARRLGELQAALLPAANAREAVRGFSALLEREGLASPLKIDLEAPAIELEVERATGTGSAGAGEARVAQLLAALCEGMLAARAGAEGRARVAAAGASAGRRFTLTLPKF